MKLASITLLLCLVARLAAGQESVKKTEPAASNDEKLLLGDISKFFERSDGFSNRGEFDTFLAEGFPAGSKDSDVKRKIFEKLDHLVIEPRMHVSVSVAEKIFVLSFWRIVFPESPAVKTFSVEFHFDAQHRLEYCPFHSANLDSWRGPPPDSDDIEPAKPRPLPPPQSSDATKLKRSG